MKNIFPLRPKTHAQCKKCYPREAVEQHVLRSIHDERKVFIEIFESFTLKKEQFWQNE